MSVQQTIESIFSQIRRYKWQFIDGFNPSSVSCLAFSVEEARGKLLAYLEQIENLYDEKERFDKEVQDLYKTEDCSQSLCSKISELRMSLRKKYPLIEENTGCYCKSMDDYSRSMKVDSGIEEITLEELITTKEPLVSEIALVEFTSCLDG